MRDELYRLAREYVDLIRAIEECNDSTKMYSLEEKRVDFHWKFIEMLKKYGIEYKDRDHATKIAFRIAARESS